MLATTPLEERPALWAYLIPLLLAILLCKAPFSQMRGEIDAREKEYVSLLPVQSHEQIAVKYDSLRNKINNTSSGNAADYFSLLREVTLLAFAAERNLIELRHGTNDGNYGPHQGQSLAIAALKRGLANSQTSIFNLNNYSREEIDDARSVYYDATISQYERQYGGTSSYYVAMYLYIAMAMSIFFVIRLLRAGLHVSVELPKIAFWSIFWVVGIFKYPQNLDIKEQYRKFKRLISTLIGLALAFLSMGPAHAKPKTADRGGNNAQTITLTEAPKPQLLPTIHVGGAAVNVFGWSFATFDSAASDTLAIRNMRVRSTVKSRTCEGFFQGNLLRDGDVFRSFTIDQLWAGCRTKFGTLIKAGRFFLPTASPTKPPFLQETIQGPGIPLKAFGAGVSVEGSFDKNVRYTLHATGETNVPIDTSGQFSTIELGGSVLQNISQGFVRGGFQRANGSMTIVLDGEKKFGARHILRGALHYQSANDQVGGYAFYRYGIDDKWSGFSQVRHVHGGSDALLGVNYQWSPNLGFTAETRTDGSSAARLRVRF